MSEAFFGPKKYEERGSSAIRRKAGIDQSAYRVLSRRRTCQKDAALPMSAESSGGVRLEGERNALMIVRRHPGGFADLSRS